MELDVFLRGGGTRLAAYLGALTDVAERGGQVARWAGTSAGALLAAVMASGYTLPRALDLLMRTEFKQFLDFKPSGVLRCYGIYAGKRLERWLNVVLEGRHFKDLTVPLSIVALDIQANQPVVFSKETTPETSLAVAVRCSVGIPGVFAVKRHNGRTLVDGGLAGIQESQLFGESKRPCVTVRLVRDRAAQQTQNGRFGLSAYIVQLATLLLDAVDGVKADAQRWGKTLLINTGPYSTINFDLTTQDKQALFAMGYDQSRRYLDLEAATGDGKRER